MINPTRIRIDNAVATTTSAPTAVTDGVAIPKQKRYQGGYHMQRIATEVVTNGGSSPTLTSFVQLREDGKLDLVLVKGGTGTVTLRVKVYFYYDKYYALTENAGSGMDTLTDVETGTWALAFDTKALSESAAFNRVYRLTARGEPDTVVLETGDLEIGAVEIKNGTDDTRAEVGVASGAAVADNALFVADPNLAEAIRQDATVVPSEITIADGTSTQSGTLTAGLYLITADIDVAFFAAANPTATASHRKLWAKSYRWAYIATASDKIAAIRLNSDTGTVSIEKVV